MTETLSILMGIYMICAGLGLVFNSSWAGRIIGNFEESAALTFLCGAVVLFAGAAIILHHNIWSGWPEIGITLIGWGAALEGAIFLVRPQLMFRFAKMIMPPPKFVPFFGLGTIALGTALIWL